MTNLETQVWAATFAAEFARERKFQMEHGGGSVDDISGFSCAEIADSAVESLREALGGDDAEYLLPVSEGEGGARRRYCGDVCLEGPIYYHIHPFETYRGESKTMRKIDHYYKIDWKNLRRLSEAARKSLDDLLKLMKPQP